MQIITDFHTHIAMSSPREMADAARAKGLRVLGFSEHVYQLSELRPLLAHHALEGSERTLAAYVDEVHAAIRQGGCELRMGLEVDYVPSINDELHRRLAHTPWDFLIGSIHEVDGELFELSSDIAPERGRKLWARYFELLRQAVETRQFSVISHPVRMRISNPHLPDDFDQGLAGLATVAARCNVALEVNGKDVLYYPNEVRRLIEACVDNKTSISVGSDAHLPDHLAQTHEQIEQLLRQCGVTAIRTWKGRADEDRKL